MRTPEAVATHVQQPTLRGWQSVAAIWFPADWFDPMTQARRIVSCWRPGATALRFAQGDLLCYATAIDMDCQSLPGWPLRQQGRALSSAVLTQQEHATAPDGDVLIVLGAEVLALHKRDAVPLDPAAWLDIGPLTLHQTYDCTSPPPSPIVLDLQARPLREVLGEVPPASPEQAKFLDALRSANRGPDRTTRQNPAWSGDVSLGFIIRCTAIILVLGHLARAVPPDVREALLTLAVLVVVFFMLLAAKGFVPTLLGKLVESSAAVAPTQERLPARRDKRPQPQRWRRVLARWLMTSQLGRMVGRAQARYMRRMLGLFEDGNLAEALRHAIPLGGTTLGQAFGTPQGRRDLTLSPGNGPSVGVDIGGELEKHLRALYRKAFEKLDREGRIDEAVFVLAELLNAKQEALDYLESHGRIEQAAELALGWDMPSAVIVRLYCLADNWQRAIAVARRDSAFSAAVLQLEKKAPEAARRLRGKWGEALTQQGDWLGAVDAVWPDVTLRPRAVEWLLTAEAAGGELAARALLQRATLLPDTLHEYAEHLEELRSNPKLWAERADLAEALLDKEFKGSANEFAAIVAPMLLVDHARGHRRFDRNLLQQLVRLSGDRLLEADLPARDWPVSQPSPIAKRTDVLELDGPAAGAHAIYDAVPLRDGRYLVALGEAGARVVDGNGRTRAHFAIPAQRLVLSDTRQVALALARRESLWRVSRIDLTQQSIVDLGMGDFQHFCAQFDGLHWSVARDNRLQVLDTHQSLREVVWQVTDLPGPVTALTCSGTTEDVLIELANESTEEWSYRLPERRLLARIQQPPPEGKLRLLNSMRGTLDVTMEQPEPEQVSFRVEWNRVGSHFEYSLRTTPQPHLVLWTEAEWLTVSAPAATGYEVHWVLMSNGQARARVRWPGERAPGIRAFNGRWLLFDTEGRLMCIDVDDGQHHNLTLR